jgi:phage protein D
MIPDLFSTDTQTPGVRRPIFEIAFGGGSGGSGPADLLSSAAAAVGFGGATGEDPWLRSVTSVSVEVGLAPQVDVAEIVIAADSQAPPVAIDDEGNIALGYEDEGATGVFTGRIESIIRSTRGPTRITIANASSALAALRTEQSYEDQGAGDVVEDLAGRAGVNTGNVVAGPDLAFTVLDGGSNAWEHIARLARVSGHHARITVDNELDFAPVDDGEAVQTFTYGVDILLLERREAAASFDNVTIVGEGAAGSDGKSAWNWLVKQPSSVTGAAGQGSRARGFSDRLLRSAEAAGTAAQALADAAARAATVGTLIVPGAPKVTPATNIAIAGSTDGVFDGAYLVTRVRHVFSKRTGFRTHITFAGSGGSSGAGGGLLSAIGGLL